MTAPSLSVPAGQLAVAWQQLRASVPPQFAGGALAGVVGVLAASWLAGAGALDPAVALLIAVIVAGWWGGLRAASTAAAIGFLFVLLTPSPDGAGRILLAGAALAAAAALAGTQRDRLERLLHGLGDGHALARRMSDFSIGLGEERPEQLPDAIVERAAALVGADLVALTVADPRTGRHHVRAVRGTNPAAVGVEVMPGVGIAGRAIRDHRTVVVGRPPESPSLTTVAMSRLQQLLGAAPTAAPAAEAADDPPQDARRVAPAMAVPAVHSATVVATLTVGRSDMARPFTADEQALLELAVPQIGLAVANGVLRSQLREASLLDPVTGLYNRSYLDAALAQLLALRRRTPAAERAPLSLILFDIDHFGRLNEQHGDAVGDHVLRAVAALLKHRFRASDTIARMGGDSFFVVLDGADTTHALAAAGDVRSQVRELALSDERGTALAVSLSAGVAMFRDEAVRTETIIRTVEAALDTARWSSPGSIVAI